MPRTVCSVINCKNYQSSSDVSFHRFPKEPERSAMWVQNLGITSLMGLSPERLNKNHRVCSAHFDDSQFRRRWEKRIGLKWNAVPTIIDAPNPNPPPPPPPPPPLDSEGKHKPPKCSESQEDVSCGVPAMDGVPLDSTNARDIPLDSTNARDIPLDSTNARDIPLDSTNLFPPSAGGIMALSDVFHSELLLVIKELINVAQLEIAKVVLSGDDRNVSMTTEGNYTNLLFTHEGQKNERMILISSILEMFGREAVRKLNRIFTECCAALQNECKQSKQEINSLKRSLKEMQKRPKKKVNIKKLLLARRKAYSSSRCNQNDSRLTAPAASLTTSRESQEDVSGGVPAMDEVPLDSTNARDVPLDSTNARDGPVHQSSKRQTVVVDLSLTPPDLFPPSPEQKSPHNGHLNETNQQTAKIKPEEPHGRDQCEKKYSHQTDLLKHKVWHDRNSQQNHVTQEVCEYKCDICDRVCADGHSLQAHKLVHLEVKPFTCSTCGRVFVSSSVLKSHKLLHTGERPFMCTVCGKRFTQSGSLKGHERRHSGEKPYMCDQCPKAFFSLPALRQHKQVHTGEKPYQCDLCQKNFSSSSSVRRHRLQHTGVKAFACLVCSKRFFQKVGLKIHMQMHEEGEKPFKCEICEKAFVYKFALRNHMLTHDGNIVHSGQKVFKCEVCNKAFTQKYYCKQHAKIHTGEKPFKCSVCSKSFRFRQARTSHMRIHTAEKPCKCDVCGLAFYIGSNLKRHMRVHTGEKPYACDVCGKRFSQRNNLKAHMQVHTGERPHACERCGRRFADVRNLKKHKCVPPR